MYSLRGKYRKALVTGGAGFIGSHLVDALLSDGLEVVSADDYSSGKHDNLKHLLGVKEFTEAECDVTDYSALSKLYAGVDIVFNQMASKMTVCLRDPRRDLDVNAKGTFNVLELARDRGVRKVVHASTGSVYGEPEYFPTDENHRYNPTSYYGVSKLAGERYAHLFFRNYGVNATILRYFHVYGPRQENSDVGGVCSIFGRNVIKGEPIVIYGDGTQQRSFTYVEDVVNINKFAALHDEDTRGQAYNCASGIKVTIEELARKVIAWSGRGDVPIRFEDWRIGDIIRFDIDNGKLRRQGFEWMTGFDAGLAKTLDWLKDYLKRFEK